MNYYPFHIGDYLSNTRHLSWEEDAAYRRLLDVYYSTEKPIPTDHRSACRLVLATTDAQREAVQVVLREFFQQTESGWINKRADAEIAIMRARQQSQRAKAKMRWHEHNTEPGIAADMPRHNGNHATASNSDADAMPPIPTPTPTPIPRKEKSKPTPRADGAGCSPPIPDWLPPADWQAFVEHRKRVRAPMTAFAQGRAIAELGRLRQDGHDPGAVIGQSIMQGWKGLFPLHSTTTRRNIHDERADTIAKLTGRYRQDRTILDIAPDGSTG